jgi:hypothetical protein
MTAKLVNTTAASVALPNAWDDAEEWEPTVQTPSARVVPFRNSDVADAAAHAPTGTARGSTRNEKRARLGDLLIGHFVVCAAAILPVVVSGQRMLGELVSFRTKRPRRGQGDRRRRCLRIRAHATSPRCTTTS